MQRNLDENTQLQNSIIINTTAPHKQQNEGLVRLKEALYLFMARWQWFLIAIVIALGAAYYYLQITPSIYRSSASIMIKADDKNGVSDEVAQSLGLKSAAVNITNEIMSMKT